MTQDPVVDRRFGSNDRRALPEAEHDRDEQHRKRGEKDGAVEGIFRRGWQMRVRSHMERPPSMAIGRQEVKLRAERAAIWRVGTRRGSQEKFDDQNDNECFDRFDAAGWRSGRRTADPRRAAGG